jgi:CO/xanthine dehydrogenase Mo-binding subunit
VVAFFSSGLMHPILLSYSPFAKLPTGYQIYFRLSLSRFMKGIGELPTLAAPVVSANAVMDALAHVGVRHIDTPLTREKIWQALHGKEA